MAKHKKLPTLIAGKDVGQPEVGYLVGSKKMALTGFSMLGLPYKVPRLGGLNSRYLFSHLYGGQKSKIKVCYRAVLFLRPFSLVYR